MEYKGKFKIFNNSQIKTYPLKQRKSKVSVGLFVDCKKLENSEIIQPLKEIENIANAVVAARKNKKPIIVITGAHLVKNGLSPIIVDLMKRNIITLFATNVASAIHSFELSLIGESSENVRDGLKKGEFGMAFETGMYINQALIKGNSMKLGFGETMGRLFTDSVFRKSVINAGVKGNKYRGYYMPLNGFKYEENCIFAQAIKLNIPVTVHASIGTDIVDQHCNFDGAAKGATSARDFLIFVNEVTKLTQGGVILNISSAVMGPEVLLKAVSMAANVGKAPKNIVTGDFDLRPYGNEDKNEGRYHYYFRDQKSIVKRIPEVYSGKGYYIEGDQKETIPSLYQYILKLL
ncbi:MAG: hypothetical protein KKH91_03220 [Elusimicrobia bacterium]|nr:hypothetical protein [Elusimicrobiota bacterium]MBU2614658.1 hypothetical protein [Elusimicrobiota bacterium]